MKGTRIQPDELRRTQAAAPAACRITSLISAGHRTHRKVGHKNSVSRYHLDLYARCWRLSQDLKSRSYKPVPGELHEVWEPKYRMTVSAKYCDRVPQSAFITNVFYPEVVSRLSEANCACIKGRGSDYARNCFKTILRNADPGDWCVKADMRNYFGTIDHQILIDSVGQLLTDDWSRWFYETTIANARNPVGIDLGSEVYQLSAAAYMDRIDRRLDDGHYLRYQDDLVYVGPKDRCKEVLEIIREEAALLRLELHPRKTYIQPIRQPVSFLGFTFLRHPTGRVTLKRRRDKLARERRKLKRMKDAGIPLDRIAEHYQAARAAISKGARSDLYAMDQFYKSLFGGVENVEH